MNTLIYEWCCLSFSGRIFASATRELFANCLLYLDPREREIGERYGACYKDSVESRLQILFTDKLKMSADDVQIMAAQVREELDDRSLKPYLGL